MCNPTQTPSFPRRRESRLSTSDIVESLDSLVRGNDERLNLTGSARTIRHSGEGRDLANHKCTPFAANGRLMYDAASNVAER
jgi:hypothetical protein